MKSFKFKFMISALTIFAGLSGTSVHAQATEELASAHSLTAGSNNGGKPWQSPAGDARLLEVYRGRSIFGPTPVSFKVGFGSRTLSVHCGTNEVGHRRVFIQIREGYDSFYDGPHNMNSTECYQRLQDKATELSLSESPLGFFDLLEPAKSANSN